MPKDPREEIISQLSSSIADDVGNMREDELTGISQTFDKTLSDALRVFNSSTFDEDGFIRRMRDLDVDASGDKGTMKNILNGIRSEYISMDAINQSELLMRRDLANISQQMPEMRDVIYIVRDAIIECNVATGEVSRSIIFENHHEESESYESLVRDIEKRHDLLMAIKNFIVPNTLKGGEMYIHVVPYAKLFAELEAMREHRENKKAGKNVNDRAKGFKESVPNRILESFSSPKSLKNDNNIRLLVESVDSSTVNAATNEARISIDESGKKKSIKQDSVTKEAVSVLLDSINVCNGTSVLMDELGYEGFQEYLMLEYKRDQQNRNKIKQDKDPGTHFTEAMGGYSGLEDKSGFGGIDQDDVDVSNYKHIKGCYIKYLDPLRMVPIRIDRRVIGYYYVTTTMDLQANAGQPNGMIDLSFQQYTRDRNMVERLAQMIINSFDKKMLERNIKLKNEIVEIIMAHRFNEGKLSFVYIPENEIVRLVVNEDEEGRGHSILEPTMFAARNYLMLTMYNMLYTLNNNTVHVHYLRSSGLNKDYAAQVQRTMRKFQSRRITIDDIYSYSGVLNKIGGMGEMVLPSGRADIKPLEHDTIEAVRNPIDIEFIEQQRRQAISGTGVPNLMIINAIDEVDFAKTLEMANSRFLSTVSSYKIDFNRGITQLYRKLLQWDSDMEDDDVRSFLFKFNAIKQQDLNITSDMLSNFDNLVQAVGYMYYSKEQLEDDNGATSTAMNLRRRLAMKYLPQLDFDELDEIVKEVDAMATDDKLKSRVSAFSIDNEDLKEVEK